MKRCLLLFIVSWMTVLTVLVPAMPGTAHADVNSDAEAFCKSVAPFNGKFPNGKVQNPFSNSEYTSCTTGYTAEINTPSKGSKTFCATISSPTWCVTGWNGAHNKTQPGTPSANAAATAAVVCNPFSGDKLDFCEQALTNQCSSYTAAHTTATFNQQATDCFKGAFEKNQRQTSTCGSNAACTHGFTTTTTPAPSPSPTPTHQLGCEFQISNALTWIVCPVVFALTQTVSFVDNLITNELNVKTNNIFCTTQGSTCGAYYNAWQSFRNIALGLMAIAGLVVVIAQALGMEILDAYTLRKVLPRLLIAAIGITLSWPLMKFMIQFSDDLGVGIRHIIYAPFAGLSSELDLSFGQSGIVGSLFGSIGGAAAATAAIPAWLVLGGPAALLSFIGTALLAVFVAIVVLILRQVAIIMFLLISPIAIVAYILPNTQRVYRLWWDNFIKALLMFPLIAAMISTGRVFAAIAINNGSTINQIIGFAAYFAPYLLIPLTFRMSGSAVGAMGNLVQSRASGGFQALNGLRANQRKSRLERVRGAGLYRKKTGIPGALNKVGHYTADLDEQLPYDLGSGTGLGRMLPGRGGKKLGGALFGRQAAEMAGEKGLQFGEQTAKGVEKANMHYSTAWAALGLRNRLEGGMTEKGLQNMDDKYGFKRNAEGGLVKTKAGEKADTWKPPANADYQGLLSYGADLRAGAESGSMAAIAGHELDEGRVGILSSFGNTMDTQRATLQSVALSSAAKDGKLDGHEFLPVINEMSRSQDPAVRAFGQAQHAQIERATQSARQDLRPGKGVRTDQNGEQYYVHGDTPIREKQSDGSYEMVPAYKTAEAYASSNSMKGQAAMGAKAESIRNQAKTIISMATNERPDLLKDGEAQFMRDSVIAGSQNTYSDPDSRLAWQEILNELPPATKEEIAAGQRRAQEEQDRNQGNTPMSPGDGPPIPPSSGISPGSSIV